MATQRVDPVKRSEQSERHRAHDDEAARRAKAAEDEARAEAEQLLAVWLTARRAGPLPSEPAVWRFLEDRLGIDAARLLRGPGSPVALPPGAAAATVDARPVFAPWAPPATSLEGFRLRAHESVHAIQQGSPARWRSAAAPHASLAPAVQFGEDEAALAPTPGGLRLGALDPAPLSAVVEKLKPLLSSYSFYEIEREYETRWNRRLESAERFYDRIDRPIRTARQVLEYELRTDARLDEARAALIGDAAVVLAQAFEKQKIEAEALEKDMTALGTTYERLAYLYSNNRIQRISALPQETRDKADDFEYRAQLFLTFAQDKLKTPSAALQRVMQGLAADTARLQAGELVDRKIIAPDRGAELVVYMLLDEPPRLDELVELYKRVLDDVRRRAVSGTSALLWMVPNQYDKEIIRKPITDALAAASAKGHVEREKARRALSITIGRFLARLTLQSAVDDLARHIPALGAAIPDQVSDAIVKADADEEAAAAAPAVASKPVTVPRVVHRCPITYGREDVIAYLEAQLAVRKRGVKPPAAPKFNPALLICQFVGSHPDGRLKVTIDHLDLWQAAATRVAKDLQRSLMLAQARDAEIGKRRAAILPEKADEPEVIPHLVVTLELAEAFWQLLEKVPDDRDLDTSDKEAQIAKTMLGYFLALRWHQNTLIRALTLVTDTEKARLDAYMKVHYANTHARVFAQLRDDALETERWPAWPGSSAFQETDGFDLDIERMRGVLDAVRRDRDAERRLQIEEDIYGHIDAAVDVVRERLKGRDVLRVEDVWPVLKESLDGLEGPADVAIAKEILQAVLEDVHRARASELYGEAEAKLVQGDTKAAADRARRIKEVLSRLDAPVAAASPDAVLDMVRGQTTNLIGLFVMSQTSLAVGAGSTDTDTPGRVMRAANLLRIALADGGAATLAEAYDWVMQAHQRRDLWVMMYDPDKRKKILKDSDRGFFDRLEIAAGPLLSSVGTVGPADEAVEVLRKSRRGGALSYLIDAENAGGGEKRDAAIVKLAEAMRGHAASHSKAVAQFLYSYLLDAVDELASAGEQLRQIKAAAEEARKKQAERKEADKQRPPGKDKTAAELKEEAEWAYAITREQDLARKAGPAVAGTTQAMLEERILEKEQKDTVIEEFKQHQHPVHKRKLRDAEEKWFQAWLDISGMDSVWPGEKGWAEVKEFGKSLLATVAIGFVTGGLGGFVRGALALEMAEGVTLSGIAIATGEIALFTETMRIVQELETKERPPRGFFEEFGVNLVMAGAGKFATMRMTRSLAMRGIDPRSIRGRLNLFAAEYVATSGVGLAHLHFGAFLRGDVVTREDIKQSLTHNFAFLVGMKTIHAGVHVPEQRFKHEQKTWKDPKVASAYERLLADVAPHDKAIEAQLAAIRDAKTPEERTKAFDVMKDRLEQKAQAIERSQIPEAANVAKDLRDMTALAAKEFQQGLNLEGAGVQALRADLPHFSYEKGSANEAALERHFKETGANFTFTERADGSRVYTVTTAEGPLRYEPRDPTTMGAGTQREAYSPSGRLKGEVVPGKPGKDADKIQDGKDVANILKADKLTSPLVKNLLVDRFSIELPGGTICSVILKAAPGVQSTSKHGAGPAVFTLTYEPGMGWQAEITVSAKAPNDHVVSGVNEELMEIQTLIPRLQAKAVKAGKKVDVYANAAELKQAMESEISATKIGDPKTPLSAHTLALLNARVPNLHTLLEQLTQARDRMGPGDPGRELLQRRIDLAEADIGAVMELLDLPRSDRQFAARMKELDKLLSPQARSSLESLHFQERHEADIGPVELQILYNEIVKARPGFAQEASREGMRAYFNAEVRARVQSEMAKARAAGKSERVVRDIGMKTARDLLTKTPTYSMRGYAAEGKYVEQYNLDPALVSETGLLYKLEKGTTTFDAAGVRFSEGRGAVSARGVPAPLELSVEQVRNSKKKLVDVLVVRDANGREIARQDAETGEVRVARKGLEVWLVSIKATNDAVITQMTKAVGTRDAPTGHGLLVSPDTSTALEGKIKKAQENVAEIDAAVRRGATHRRGQLNAARKRLAQLEFIQENLVVVDKASHTRLDTVIEALKEELVDVDAIVADIKKGRL